MFLIKKLANYYCGISVLSRKIIIWAIKVMFKHTMVWDIDAIMCKINIFYLIKRTSLSTVLTFSFLASFAFGCNGSTSCLALWKQIILSSIITHFVDRFSADNHIYLLTRLLCLLRKCPCTFIHQWGRWQQLLLVVWWWCCSTEWKNNISGNSLPKMDHSSCTFHNISEETWVILLTFGLQVLIFVPVCVYIWDMTDWSPWSRLSRVPLSPPL